MIMQREVGCLFFRYWRAVEGSRLKEQDEAGLGVKSLREFKTCSIMNYTVHGERVGGPRQFTGWRHGVGDKMGADVSHSGDKFNEKLIVAGHKGRIDSGCHHIDALHLLQS